MGLLLASKTGKTYHTHNEQFPTPYASGDWKSSCSKNMPEVSMAQIKDRELRPCRVCITDPDLIG